MKCSAKSDLNSYWEKFTSEIGLCLSAQNKLFHIPVIEIGPFYCRTNRLEIFFRLRMISSLPSVKQRVRCLQWPGWKDINIDSPRLWGASESPVYTDVLWNYFDPWALKELSSGSPQSTLLLGRCLRMLLSLTVSGLTT